MLFLLCGSLFAALLRIPLMLDMVFTITSVKLLVLYLMLDANEVFLHGRLPPTLPDIESEI